MTGRVQVKTTIEASGRIIGRNPDAAKKDVPTAPACYYWLCFLLMGVR